jgi:hypothetical protein
MINILFACTTLNEESSIVEYFDYMNDIFVKIDTRWFSIDKNAYFIYKIPDTSTLPKTFQEIVKEKEDKRIKSRYGETIMKKHNYNIIDVYDINLHDFLKNHVKYDFIVFTQCSNLIDTLLGEKDKSKIKLIENLQILYKSLNDDGHIINFYYDNDGNINNSNIETFYSFTSIHEYYLHALSVNMFNSIFENISKGCYVKKLGIDIFSTLKKTYVETIQEFGKYYKEKNSDAISKIVSEKYFGGTIDEDDMRILKIKISDNIKL